MPLEDAEKEKVQNLGAHEFLDDSICSQVISEQSLLGLLQRQEPCPILRRSNPGKPLKVPRPALSAFLPCRAYKMLTSPLPPLPWLIEPSPWPSEAQLKDLLPVAFLWPS